MSPSLLTSVVSSCVAPASPRRVPPRLVLQTSPPRKAACRSIRSAGGMCLLLLLTGACGCSGSVSAERSLDKALAQSGRVRETVFPLAGKVTIDDQPPPAKSTVAVMLSDPSKPDAPIESRPTVECDREGKFSFTTYKSDDGLPGPKTYVIAFALLHKSRERLVGPDEFENRFNDADKNAKIAEFVLEHTAPGKKDYVFNLKIDSVPPGTPGPHSLTRVE